MANKIHYVNQSGPVSGVTVPCSWGAVERITGRVQAGGGGAQAKTERVSVYSLPRKYFRIAKGFFEIAITLVREVPSRVGMVVFIATHECITLEYRSDTGSARVLVLILLRI